jgi:uncharacterized protein with gpF-like domain
MFGPNQLAENWMRRQVLRMLNGVLTFPKSNADALENVLTLARHYSNLSFQLGNFPYRVADKMVTMTARGNAISWKEAASKSGQGKILYGLLKYELNSPQVKTVLDSLIYENAKLITSVPNEVANHLANFIEQEQVAGVRPNTISDHIASKLTHLKMWQVNRLARTESSKADTAITRVRSVGIGLNWYVWDTSEDARVRASHRLMNQVLVNWSDPPSPEALLGIANGEGHYHAGNIWNCRCIPLPLIDLDEVKWPMRVYHFGQINKLTREQFSRIM